MFQTKSFFWLDCFGHFNFEHLKIVSDFVFRISDLIDLLAGIPTAKSPPLT